MTARRLNPAITVKETHAESSGGVRQLAEGGAAGGVSTAGARRLSTGRSIRAWRRLCGRQMTRNGKADATLLTA